MKTKLTILALLILSFSYLYSKPCTSIQFDTNSANPYSFVELPESNIYLNNGGAFTWEFWFKINKELPDTGTGFHQMMISIDQNNPAGWNDVFIGFGDIYSGAPKSSLVFRVNNQYVAIPKSAHNIVPGVWYFVAGVCNPSTGLILYLYKGDCAGITFVRFASNGNSVSNLTGLTSPRLGKWDSPSPTDNTHSQFLGNLDDIRFWNVALSESQIVSHARTCFTSPYPDGLSAYYPVSDTAGLSLKEMIRSLDGVITNCRFRTTPPISNAAPLICCCECPEINFQDEGNCCFNFSFYHSVPTGSGLTRVTLQILTPGVSFTSASTSGTCANPPYNWYGSVINPTLVEYRGLQGFDVGQLVETLRFCVNNPSSSSFTIRWITWKEKDTLCVGEDRLRCQSQHQFDTCTSIKFNTNSIHTYSFVDLSASTIYLNNGGAFTWEFWFKINSPLPDSGTGFYQMMISIDQNNPVPGNDVFIGFGDIYSSAHRNSLVFRVNNQSVVIPAANHGITPGVWYFVAGVCNPSSGLTLYLFRGSCDESALTFVYSATNTNSVTNLAGQTSPRLGKWDSPSPTLNAHSQFIGNLDEIRFWGRPLSYDEIESHARACFVSDSLLVAYYPVWESDIGTGSLREMVSGLHGTVINCTFQTSPPIVNAAPLDCCCEPEVPPCDSIHIDASSFNTNNYPKYECIKLIKISVSTNIPGIAQVHFSTIPTMVFEVLQGPTGWTQLSPTIWQTPGGNLPAGTHNFLLGFNSYGTFQLMVNFVSPSGYVVCRDTLLLSCCCDNFRFQGRLMALQVNNSIVIINGFMSAYVTNPLTPIQRVSATLVYAKSSYWGHIYSDFSLVRGSGPWVPPGSLSNLCGIIPGPQLQSFWARYPFSREVIWGNYNNVTSTALVLGCPFGIEILFPSTPPGGDILHFGIRFSFTDTTCCTCDTLVDFVRSRFRLWNPFSVESLAFKSKGDVSLQRTDTELNDDEKFSKIIMETSNTGTLYVANLSSKDWEYPYRITRIELMPDANVSITSLRDNKTGKLATIINGKANLDVSIGPEEIADFELNYDNPSNYLIIPNNITLYLVFKDLETDTIQVSETVVARAPNAGGDIVEVDETTKLEKIFTFGLCLKNLNLGGEPIKRIELKPKYDDKILAVGSDAISSSALVGIYRLNDNIVALSEPLLNSEVTSLEPNGIVKPIYITLKTSGKNSISLVYKTFNSQGDVITSGEIEIPLSVINSEKNGSKIYDCIAYPNPTTGNFVTFFFSNDEDLQDVSLKIYDATGREVATVLQNNYIPSGKNAILFDISGFASGKYYWVIVGKDFRSVQQFTIIK